MRPNPYKQATRDWLADLTELVLLADGPYGDTLQPRYEELHNILEQRLTRHRALAHMRAPQEKQDA